MKSLYYLHITNIQSIYLNQLFLGQWVVSKKFYIIDISVIFIMQSHKSKCHDLGSASTFEEILFTMSITHFYPNFNSFSLSSTI